MNTTVSIPAIHCNGCAMLIKDVSSEFPSITRTDVDVDTKRVMLEHDASFDLATWIVEIQSANPSYVVHPAV